MDKVQENSFTDNNAPSLEAFRLNISDLVHCSADSPNIASDWAALVRIREVPGFDLDPESGYPVWGFLWLFLVPPGECWDRAFS
jgi:hypothetical protein